LGSFTPEELAIAHQHLNPGKSLDLDSIYTEFILHLNLGFAISSLQLKISKIWRRALIVAIPKPEKPLGDPNSYHPISLQCVPFKIL